MSIYRTNRRRGVRHTRYGPRYCQRGDPAQNFKEYDHRYDVSLLGIGISFSIPRREYDTR